MKKELAFTKCLDQLVVENAELKKQLADKPKCETCRWFINADGISDCFCPSIPMRNKGVANPQYGCIYHEKKV